MKSPTQMTKQMLLFVFVETFSSLLASFQVVSIDNVDDCYAFVHFYLLNALFVLSIARFVWTFSSIIAFVNFVYEPTIGSDSIPARMRSRVAKEKCVVEVLSICLTIFFFF